MLVSRESNRATYGCLISVLSSSEEDKVYVRNLLAQRRDVAQGTDKSDRGEPDDNENDGTDP